MDRLAPLLFLTAGRLGRPRVHPARHLSSGQRLSAPFYWVKPPTEEDEMGDMRAKLSTLWIVVMFNMLFADVLTLYIPAEIQDVVAGTTEVRITDGLMLAMAALIEIPIVMIFLSRYLRYRANRWTNIIASVVTVVFVVAGGSTILHYLLFAGVEVVCLALIGWYAWRWQDQGIEASIATENGLRISVSS